MISLMSCLSRTVYCFTNVREKVEPYKLTNMPVFWYCDIAVFAVSDGYMGVPCLYKGWLRSHPVVAVFIQELRPVSVRLKRIPIK